MKRAAPEDAAHMDIHVGFGAFPGKCSVPDSFRVLYHCRLQQQFAGLESLLAELVDVQIVMLTGDIIRHQLGYARTYHETMTGETAHGIEVLAAFRLVDDGVAVGTHVILAGPLANHVQLAQDRKGFAHHRTVVLQELPAGIEVVAGCFLRADTHDEASVGCLLYIVGS